MAEPTPEVRQRRLAAIRQAIELGHVGGNEDTEWLLEDVERLEALLTARAQEIEQVKAAQNEKRDISLDTETLPPSREQGDPPASVALVDLVGLNAADAALVSRAPLVAESDKALAEEIASERENYGLDQYVALIAEALARVRTQGHAPEDDGGLAETERRHSRACREQEALRRREAEVWQAGYEHGVACRDQFEALVSRAPQQEQDDYDEAKRYLTSLFAQVAPQCKPLPTLSGLATQIDNYIAGLRAAPVPASAALQDWQPIETAPKDGTHLLVCDARRPYTAFWGFGQNPPTVGHYFVQGWHLSVNHDGEHSEIHPTHWRPLPDPPLAAALARADQP